MGKRQTPEQWESTSRNYVSPVFGALPVQNVDVALVLKALEPIWTTKPETAGRVRGRIERILDWAKARGLREGENPAYWRGHLDILLAPRGKVRQVRQHMALPYGELPGFLLKIRQRDAVAAHALEFAILTAARTGEVLGARWEEIDLETKIWTVPASRMKAGRKHRVPLSMPACVIVKRLEVIRQNGFVLPGERWNIEYVRADDTATSRAPRTALDRRSVTGQPSRQPFRARWLRPLWLRSLPTAPKQLIGAAICLRNAVV